jgi:hypothetical protein
MDRSVTFLGSSWGPLKVFADAVSLAESWVDVPARTPAVTKPVVARKSLRVVMASPLVVFGCGDILLRSLV